MTWLGRATLVVGAFVLIATAWFLGLAGCSDATGAIPEQAVVPCEAAWDFPPGAHLGLCSPEEFTERPTEPGELPPGEPTQPDEAWYCLARSIPTAREYSGLGHSRAEARAVALDDCQAHHAVCYVAYCEEG